MKPKNIFGTDGIRDIAGQGFLVESRVSKLGSVIGHLVRSNPEVFSVDAPFLSKVNNIRPVSGLTKANVLLGMDTRISSPEICRWLIAGFENAGVSVANVGLCPTPAAAFLTRLTGCACGVVVSASHNPPEHNGIKLISPQGAKVNEACEEMVTELIFDPSFSCSFKPAKKRGVTRSEPALLDRYLDHYKLRFRGLDLKGKKIVVDLANGATIKTAVRLLESFGANVIAINDSTDGSKINVGCGAEHTEMMACAVTGNKAFVGFSFDGDGDRVIACDERGAIVDGDGIMAILVKNHLERNNGKRTTVVGTEMTNYGLEIFLKKVEVGFVRAKVGDKYVFRDMNKYEALFGGEPSGHIIALEDEITGDGVVNALLLLEALQNLNMNLADVHTFFPRMHQARSDLPVSKKIPIESIPQLSDEIERVRQRLGDKGRVVVRYSGTEPVLRIMVECEDRDLGNDLSASIASSARKALR